ncbi:hypothetical protein [Enterococcus termitis]|uniref:Stage III sporulation protein AC n=1 Tax=Enterococcus termitis TaxID=332950 RepID=A0A1E5GB09_9ENTE|nr:hypothetical protein [Enterococcus termitis]OEG09873.1 hypothetical protein BCR25_10240 [Enterococcus termitis]
MSVFFEVVRLIFFIAIIYMVIVLEKDFRNLKTSQKLAVSLVIFTGIIILIPDFIAFGNGFIKGLTESIFTN